MIKELKGNLLDSNCDVICHQVNLQGVMGGGLALQIATKYPHCEKEYKEYCKKYNGDLLGRVCFYEIKDFKYIANCFSQNEDFTTNYKWLEYCVNMIYEFAKKHYLRYVGIPKNYGCGIAKGDWNRVKAIWCDKFKDSEIELQIWEY